MINNDNLRRKNTVFATELFYLGFIILLSALTLSHTIFIDFFPNRIVLLIRIFSYIILTSFILINSKAYSFSLKKIILYVAFVTLSLISFYYSHAYYILDSLFLGTAAAKIDFRDVIKVYLIIQISITLVTIFGDLSGALTQQDFGFRTNLFGDTIRRRSLGFLYTTLGVQIFFYCNLAYWYLRRQLIGALDICFILIVNIFFYNETGTRNAFLLIMIEIVILIVLRFKGPKLLGIFLNHKSFKYIFFIIFALSYYLGANYDGSRTFYVMLNSIVSGRLRLTRMAFDMFPAKLFGNDLYAQYQNYLTAFNISAPKSFLDSSYMQLFFNTGIVYTISFLLLLTWLFGKAIESKDFYLVIILLFIAIQSSMDPQLFEFSYNIFILLIFRFFFSDKLVS